MNLKHVEAVETMIHSPLFIPQKTETWPLLSRKNLPQSEFINLKVEKLFLWKNPADNSVSSSSITITSWGWGTGGESAASPQRTRLILPISSYLQNK